MSLLLSVCSLIIGLVKRLYKCHNQDSAALTFFKPHLDLTVQLQKHIKWQLVCLKVMQLPILSAFSHSGWLSVWWCLFKGICTLDNPFEWWVPFSSQYRHGWSVLTTVSQRPSGSKQHKVILRVYWLYYGDNVVLNGPLGHTINSHVL